MLWGASISKSTPYKLEPQQASLSFGQVSLTPQAKPGKNFVFLSQGDGAKYALCCLEQNKRDFCSVDLELMVDEDITHFTVEGNSEIHITGSLLPTNEHDDMGGSESDESEDEEMNEGTDTWGQGVQLMKPP
eukprot:Platyproteum_vivax@DN3052_c0_g1_i2.p2